MSWTSGRHMARVFIIHGGRVDQNIKKTGFCLNGPGFRSTLFSKRKATFFKLPFFWRRVYTSESGVIHQNHQDPMSGSLTQGRQEKWTD